MAGRLGHIIEEVFNERKFAEVVTPQIGLTLPREWAHFYGDDMAQLDEVLQERGSDYGDFESHADVTQALKYVVACFRRTQANGAVKDYHQEAIDMIFHKIGRALNGNPNIEDHWVDIAGYATLVADIIRRKQS